MKKRKATTHDIPEIAKLLYQVHDVHVEGRSDLFKKGSRKYTDEALEKYIHDEKKVIFLAIGEENRTLGHIFCVLKNIEENDSLQKVKTLFIDDFCVDKNSRSGNIGKQLYDFVENYAKEIGCYNLTLDVYSFNERAIAFYEKCGLANQKVVMEKILK